MVVRIVHWCITTTSLVGEPHGPGPCVLRPEALPTVTDCCVPSWREFAYANQPLSSNDGRQHR
jgi:hypothetical protein